MFKKKILKKLSICILLIFVVSMISCEISIIKPVKKVPLYREESIQLTIKYFKSISDEVM